MDYVRGEAPKVLYSGQHPFAAAGSVLVAYAPDASTIAIAGDSELALFDALSPLPASDVGGVAGGDAAVAARALDSNSKPESSEYTLCPRTLYATAILWVMTAALPISTIVRVELYYL